MKWRDRAVILSARKFGESSLIVNVLSENHGRYAGVVKGGKSKSARGLYQAGNIVQAIWNARLSEHIGLLGAEMLSPVAAMVMDERLKLAALVSACHLLDCSLWEREPQPAVFFALLGFLESLTEAVAHCAERPEILSTTEAVAHCREELTANWKEKYVLLELELLKRLGFGMDLEYCAATGVRDDLIYVSPKSGRAVCREAGEKYRDKLLPLPGFVTYGQTRVELEDILHGVRLTGYFLGKHVFAEDNKRMPLSRARFVEMLKIESQMTEVASCKETLATLQLATCN